MSFAINHLDGDHLGFILLAGGPDRGEAIVRFLPTKSEHFDSLEGKLLADLMDAGEFEWVRSQGEITAHAKTGPCSFNIRGEKFFCSARVFGLIPLRKSADP